MDLRKNSVDYISERGFVDFVPGISIDCVVFGYHQQRLHVLLLRWKYQELWSLPGGFLGKDEELEDAVNRVLFERTGLQDIFLRQFRTFSSLNRHRKEDELREDTFKKIFKSASPSRLQEILKWLSQRFITTGFLAMLESSRVNLHPDPFSDSCEWIPVDQLPSLILDHKNIIQMALFQMRLQLNYWPVGKSLLPERFTMMDLQTLYEVILQKPLDRGNFQRKMRKLDVLKRHEKLMTGAANKAPYLYSFDEEVYFKLLEEGIGFS
ncbi:MAG: NUDIX domain-containing protein [Bacteroidia bacterium]|nr:NUDIX domain-containing protein [Bacteroidia bacterium]